MRGGKSVATYISTSAAGFDGSTKIPSNWRILVSPPNDKLMSRKLLALLSQSYSCFFPKAINSVSAGRSISFNQWILHQSVEGRTLTRNILTLAWQWMWGSSIPPLWCGAKLVILDTYTCCTVFAFFLLLALFCRLASCRSVGDILRSIRWWLKWM